MSIITNKRTKSDIVQELREKGYKTSFRTKQDALKLLDNISWFKTFPWNDDQKEIINWGIHDKKESVCQGVFGSGKVSFINFDILKINH
jgi:repressor of nif and glnA expression